MAPMRPRYNMNTGKMVHSTLLGMPADPVVFQFGSGVEVEIGRGTTDADETYIATTRQDGTKVYQSVPTGTTVAVSTTKP